MFFEVYFKEVIQSNMKNTFYIVLVSLIIGLFSVRYSLGSDFYNTPDSEIVSYAVFDVIISCLVVLIILKFNSRTRLIALKNQFAFYKTTIEHYYWLILLLSMYMSWLAFKSVKLILSGAVRQELLFEHQTMGIDFLLISSIFKLIFPIVIYLWCNKKLSLVVSIGFFSSMLVTASRNELTYAGYMLLTLSVFSKDFKVYFKLLVILLVFLLFAVFITVFGQDRPIADGFFALFSVLDKHLTYKAYSVHLAQYPIAESSFEKVFYPFFGYLSEWPLGHVFKLDYPVDSDYVKNYHYLGVDSTTNRILMANVVYPWWSWFIGVFGILGLIIKAVYLFLLLQFYLYVRWSLSFIYLLCYVLYVAGAGTPMLTLSGVITIALCMSMDFLNNRFFKKRLSVRNE